MRLRAYKILEVIVKKQLFIALLVPWFLFYLTGCYSMYDITKEDLTPKNYDSDLHIITNTGGSYLFKANNYRVRNDTLFSFTNKIIGDSGTTTLTKIPLKDISALQTEKINTGSTVILIALVAFIAIAVFETATHPIFEGGSLGSF